MNRRRGRVQDPVPSAPTVCKEVSPSGASPQEHGTESDQHPDEVDETWSSPNGRRDTMLTSDGISMREIMALIVFGLGLTACAGGLWTILAREYQQTMRRIAAQSDRLHARALTEVGLVPVVDSATRLVEAVNQMVRTAMGVGAFLCLMGLALCLVAGWLLGV